MSFLPAGAEDSEDDDYFDDYNIKDNYQQKTTSLNNSVTTEPKPTFNEIINLKPKRDSLVGTASEPLLLDDIRMIVINGDLEQLIAMIEKTNTFFVDTVLMVGWTALMYASHEGHPHIVHYLLERGADPNYHSDDYFTPLMAVCSGRGAEENQLKCMQYLISFGADVNSLDKYGNNCLIFAAKAGKSDLTEELIINKIEINRPNNDGWNALHWAVREGQGRVVEKLLTNNIDFTLRTNSEKTAEDIAVAKGHRKIKEILQNIRDRVNEMENLSDNQNIGLTDEEINSLVNYVKPVFEIRCREKPKSKPKLPNIEELEDFLIVSNYEYLLPEFERLGYGYHDLVTNTEEVLQRVGVTEPSIIRKISAHIILIHRQDWKKESLKDFELKTSITSPEVMSILANIASHLTRIDQTILFLKKTIAKRPDILNENTDITSKNKILNETLQTMINTRCLYQDVQSLHTLIKPIEDYSEPQTPDVLSIPFTLEDELFCEIKPKNRFIYSNKMLLSVVTISALGLLAVKYGNINCENSLKFIINRIPNHSHT